MLKTHSSSSSHSLRWAVGPRWAVMLSVLLAGAVYAAQAESPVAPAGLKASVEINMTVRVAGQIVATPRLITQLGSTASMSYKPQPNVPESHHWKVQLSPTLLADGRLQLVSQISTGVPLRALDGPQTLISAAGKPFAMKVSDGTSGPTLELDYVMHLLDAAKP